ncbi:hypothetical protein QFZ35_003193 [Arthrobacter ulcerisalmonis]|nr:hypothetical protein [Arthrobacter ulcerisalmonis]MDQ0664695.1 hypothetical protein [Arthrobacter ulcerisalmonis]
MDILTTLQPAIGPVAGGALTLIGGYFASKRTDKAARATERRKLSHDSAREVVSQLGAASGIARRNRVSGSFQLTEAGNDQLMDCCSTMEHHARYIDDAKLQEAVTEAIGFLRPPPEFEEYLGKSVSRIVYDVQQWIPPMVQAHIMGKPMPDEPDFLPAYRSTFEEVEDNWNRAIEHEDQAYREEVEKAKTARS